MKQLLTSERLVCGVLLTALLAVYVSKDLAYGAEPAAITSSGPGSLSGIWTNAEYKGTGQHPASERNIRTVDGKAPPLLPKEATLLEKRIKEADQGEVFANTLSECLPGGIPMILFGAAYPIQIIESATQVTMLFEEQNHFRQIALGGIHPSDPDPSYWGNSVGHWEAGTLVVDTIALNDKTTLDMVGTPHTDKLHVTERYRRIAADKIEVRVTIDDPGAFSKSWEAKTTWKAAAAGTQVNEYICDNNRNTADSQGHQSFGHH